MTTDAVLSELADELRREHLGDLADAMTQLEATVASWWHQTMQWSFTDHGLEHSRRVAGYARGLYSTSPVSQDGALNVVEKFVLIAAAWVHDIGMQNAHESDTRESVRRAHPQRSHDLIVAAAPGYDLPTQDGSVRDAVATVVLAHGTDFYTSTVAEMDPAVTLRGFPIRLALLAAILLMADELDLHNGRAIPGTIKTQLEPLTQAHWLKHQCVTDVQISVSRNEIQLNVALAFPSGLTPGDQIAIQQWIAFKLQKQMLLVEKELFEGFDGRFVFRPQVDFTRRTLSSGNTFARPEVLAIIKADNARSKLINHNAALQEAKNALSSGSNVTIVGADGDPGKDPDGRHDLVQALMAYAQSDGVIVADAPRPDAGTSQEASDALSAWMADLQVEVPADLDGAPEPRRREALVAHLEGALRTGTSRVLLVASGWDQLSAPTARWLATLGLPRLSSLGHVSLLLSSTGPSKPSGMDSSWTEVDVGDTDAAALKNFVRGRIGRRAESLVDIWTTYSAAKQLSFANSAESAFH